MFYLLVMRWSDTAEGKGGLAVQGTKASLDKELASTSPYHCVLINQSISADTASF